jgi:hypothetical protein
MTAARIALFNFVSTPFQVQRLPDGRVDFERLVAAKVAAAKRNRENADGCR